MSATPAISRASRAVSVVRFALHACPKPYTCGQSLYLQNRRRSIAQIRHRTRNPRRGKPETGRTPSHLAEVLRHTEEHGTTNSVGGELCDEGQDLLHLHSAQ